jgi:hypothetical protein
MLMMKVIYADEARWSSQSITAYIGTIVQSGIWFLNQVI